ncbi:hypothetical protein [Methylobacterium gossipiicola]|uniref:hypothetical protein n=1 Tax=Methylobacterium gossipiicola TaxID=582675 RepID=UPI0011608087|nr:hypothetical protein [Methylobacterium gossipiicola]
MSDHIHQREADAAFFEDWSPWASLDGRPVRPAEPQSGPDARRPVRPPLGGWSRYWCLPSPGERVIRVVPATASIVDLLRAIPGARVERRIRSDCDPGVYVIPAEHWRRLRAVLPRIRFLTMQQIALYR